MDISVTSKVVGRHSAKLADLCMRLRSELFADIGNLPRKCGVVMAHVAARHVKGAVACS
jgi:hypothetical protein